MVTPRPVVIKCVCSIASTQLRSIRFEHLEEHVLELLERLDKVEAKLGIITPKMEPNVSKVTLTRDVLPQPPEEEEENNE